jgi:flagellar basal body-associated protein FliL
MKLIVILVIVAVLLLGGGGAVYFFKDTLFGGADGEAQTAAKLPINAETAVDFVDLETLNIAVIHNRRIEKHVVLQVSLEVVSDEARVTVSKSLPRIKDAFIKDLYDYYAIMPPGQQGVNVEAIKKRLKRTVDGVMRDDRVKAVLIQGAVERETLAK